MSRLIGALVGIATVYSLGVLVTAYVLCLTRGFAARHADDPEARRVLGDNHLFFASAVASAVFWPTSLLRAASSAYQMLKAEISKELRKQRRRALSLIKRDP